MTLLLSRGLLSLPATSLLRRQMSTSIHKVALEGFKTGTNDFYDVSRPSYPVEVLRKIHDEAGKVVARRGGDGPIKVVEVGAGTVS